MRKLDTDLQNIFMNVIKEVKKSMLCAIKEKELDISPIHFMVLKDIYNIENCTALSLAEKADKDKGQITRLVKDLISKDLVIKEQNPNDKRSQFLKLTNAGLDCYQQLSTVHNHIFALLSQDISDEDLALFLTLGDKMVNNLKTKVVG